MCLVSLYSLCSFFKKKTFYHVCLNPLCRFMLQRKFFKDKTQVAYVWQPARLKAFGYDMIVKLKALESDMIVSSRCLGHVKPRH